MDNILTRRAYVLKEIKKNRLHSSRPMGYKCLFCKCEAFPIKISSVKTLPSDPPDSVDDYWVKTDYCTPCMN